MRYLAHVTGDKSYSEKVDKFYERVRGQPSIDGLWPNCFEKAKGKIHFGADSDSFYEYLLKVYIQGGEKDTSLWKMYDEAVAGMEKHLVKEGPDGLTYLGVFKWDGWSGGTYEPDME